MGTNRLAVMFVATLLMIAVACSGGSSVDGQPLTASQSDSEGKDAKDSTQALSAGSNSAESSPDNSLTASQLSQPVQPKEGTKLIEVEVGQQYSAGTRVSFAEFGLSFVIPEGWQGTLPQDSPAFIMTSSVRPESAVFAVSQSATTTDQMISELLQPIPLDDNVVMTAQGQPEVDGQWVTSRVTASDGVNTLDGYITGLARESGSGMAFIGLGPKEESEYFRLLVGGLAADTETFEPATVSSQSGSSAGDPRDASPLAKEWIQYFNGMRLTYISTYSSGLSGGTSTKYEYDLCSDGRFAYSDSSSLSLNTAGASAFQNAQGGGGGQWKIITEGDRAAIEFRYGDGTVSQRLLEFVDGETQLDGERWFVTEDNNNCQ